MYTTTGRAWGKGPSSRFWLSACSICRAWKPSAVREVPRATTVNGRGLTPAAYRGPEDVEDTEDEEAAGRQASEEKGHLFPRQQRQQLHAVIEPRGAPDHQENQAGDGDSGATAGSVRRMSAPPSRRFSATRRPPVVPVAITATESMQRLRTWASGRCLDASGPGVYCKDGTPPPKAGRRVQRPEDN